jgi:hypothetical protein
MAAGAAGFGVVGPPGDDVAPPGDDVAPPGDDVAPPIDGGRRDDGSDAGITGGASPVRVPSAAGAISPEHEASHTYATTAASAGLTVSDAGNGTGVLLRGAEATALITPSLCG